MTPISRAALAAALLALAACGGADGVTDPTLPIEPTIPTTPTTPTSPTPTVPAAAVRISPRQTTLLPGASARLTASAMDAAGNLLPDATITWVSLDATTVSASAGGQVGGLKVGLARIVAISGAARDTAVVSVTTTPPPPVGSVAVTPQVLTIAPGAGQQLAALARDAGGTPLTDRPLAWSSTAPAVATVTAAGYVRGVATGSALVVVSSEARADTVRVTVSAPGGQPAQAIVTTVSIAPAALDLTVGGTQQLLASAFDAEGRAVSGRAVTWGSANGGVAAVSATGVVTAVAAGTTTVTATVDGVPAEITVRVSPPAPVPTSVVASATSLALVAGGTHDATATLRDQNGAAMGGYNIAWSTGNAAVATVSATGRITAVNNGTTTITASAAGLSARITVTVTGGSGASGGSLSLAASSFGSVAVSGGQTVLLPSVLVVGDDDPAGLSGLQAIAIFSLGGVPAGATISSAKLDVAIDTAATFGNPYALGALYAERTTTIDVATAAPGATSLLLASTATPAISAELRTLVQAAIAAGDDYVAIRFRFAQPSNANAQTDQVELAIGSLALSW